MGHKIFVSYKYADDNVKKITDEWWVTDTVRTYVDKLEEYISDTSEHTYDYYDFTRYERIVYC